MRLFALSLTCVLIACTNPQSSRLSGSSPTISYVNLQSLPDTIGIEHQDRVNRLNRLANLYRVKPPQIDQLQLNPGTIPGVTYPIPVVRILFDEGVFFDFNKDTVRPDGQKALDIIAENMKRDVPDAKMLILGHTDAVGSDSYNLDLSQRRAANVMQALINRGVRANQLATVAIGKRQPIASNNTEEGRALNRRVEFMISANQTANLTLVERRRIIQDYLPSDSDSLKSVEVLIPKTEQGQPMTLQSAGAIQLQQPTQLVITPNQPEEYQRNKLNSEFVL